MFSGKDYSTMTLDELVSEKKKMTSQKIIPAALIGLLVGIAVGIAVNIAMHGATSKKFIFTGSLLVLAFLISYGYSHRLKSIQAEINRRDTMR